MVLRRSVRSNEFKCSGRASEVHVQSQGCGRRKMAEGIRCFVPVGIFMQDPRFSTSEAWLRLSFGKLHSAWEDRHPFLDYSKKGRHGAKGPS
jgi:hypothetical protein